MHANPEVYCIQPIIDNAPSRSNLSGYILICGILKAYTVLYHVLSNIDVHKGSQH
jgi:hypothetical protein